MVTLGDHSSSGHSLVGCSFDVQLFDRLSRFIEKVTDSEIILDNRFLKILPLQLYSLLWFSVSFPFPSLPHSFSVLFIPSLLSPLLFLSIYVFCYKDFSLIIIRTFSLYFYKVFSSFPTAILSDSLPLASFYPVFLS